MPFWDEVFWQLAKGYPDIESEQMHIDALSARFVTHPDRFAVVVGSNLFGDILTDLGAAIAGSIGIAASANLNPERAFPSMFEPVHGSAPDIADRQSTRADLERGADAGSPRLPRAGAAHRRRHECHLGAGDQDR
jgi:tartrate dehydrogenase/decarboxylase/D-malate dehydrogenase